MQSDFATYHLWKLKEWKKGGIRIPDIIVGSDDPGIFATSISYEYAHIYSGIEALNETEDPMIFINDLANKSKRRAFLK